MDVKYDILDKQTVQFATLANFVALKGEQSKKINHYLPIWLIYYLIYILDIQ